MAHRKPAWDVAFSPDGSRLVSVGEDSTLRAWDAATGEEMHCVSLTESGNSLTESGTSVDYSRDGKWVAVAAPGYGTVVIDGRTNAEVTILGDSSSGWDVAFSSDSTKLAFFSLTSVHVVDIGTWEETARFPSAGSLQSVAFSPDGSRIAASDDTGRMRAWRLPET